MKIIKAISILLLGMTQHYLLASDHYGSHANPAKHSDQQGTVSQPPMREITPAAGPMVSAGADIFITADYILWKTSTGNVNLIDRPYKFGAEITYGGSTIVREGGSTGTQTRLTYGWDSGFKVGLGANIGHDGWALSAEYTWLRPNASRALNAQTNSDGTISYLRRELDQVTFWAESITETETFQFNNIDLTVGRNFYLSQYLTMNPYVGLKGTWQKWDIRGGIKNAALLQMEPNRDFVTNKIEIGDGYVGSVINCPSVTENINNSIWGIGITAGIDLGYFITKSFSIYGNFSGASLFQSYAQDQDGSSEKGKFEESGLSGEVSFSLAQSETSYALLPWLHSELGLKYDAYFDEDQYHLSIQVGWENQWFGDWLYTIKRGTQSLTLGGLNIKARFDF